MCPKNGDQLIMTGTRGSHGEVGTTPAAVPGLVPQLHGIQYSTQVPTVTRNSVEMTEEKLRQSFLIRHQREDEGATTTETGWGCKKSRKKYRMRQGLSQDHRQPTPQLAGPTGMR